MEGSESHSGVKDAESTYEFDASTYDDFIMETSKKLECEFCHNSENKFFFIKNLKFLCQQCIRGPDVTHPFEESTFSIIKVINLPHCIFHNICKEKARWNCSKTGYSFCDACHIRSCLYLEGTEYSCEPRPLFEINNGQCTKCEKIPAEIEKDDGSRICRRCSALTFIPASRVPSAEIGKLIEKYSSLLEEANILYHSNALQHAKFRVYLNELNSASSFRYLFQNTHEIDQALVYAKEQIGSNMSKRQKVGFIYEFLRKQNLIQDIIKNAAVCNEDFLLLLNQLNDLINDSAYTYSSIQFELTSHITENVCSQNSISQYNAKSHSQESGSQISNEVIKLDPEWMAIRIAVENDILDVSNAPLNELENSRRIMTEVVYFRDPFWIFPIIPGQDEERNRILNFLKTKFIKKAITANAIQIGTNVVFEDVNLHKEDGYPFKRGFIERLPSYPGGTYCVVCADFGRKIRVRLANLYECPSNIEKSPATVFHARLIGMRPVSKFTFTRNQPYNAYRIMQDLNKLCRGKVYIEMLFTQNEYYFCKIYSRNAANEMVDWSQAILDKRAAVPFNDRNGCYLQKEDYCYLYHVMGQCYIRHECNKVHECSFCGKSHRLNSCYDYFIAEDSYQNGADSKLRKMEQANAEP